MKTTHLILAALLPLLPLALNAAEPPLPSGVEVAHPQGSPLQSALQPVPKSASRSSTTVRRMV